MLKAAFNTQDNSMSEVMLTQVINEEIIGRLAQPSRKTA